ncbi:ribonucleoside-diphosphate reductase beta chain [Catenulispora sp. GP43]|uniref:R2-like ligand-binding oxidase n=1 Tax=Catenulispora sp. GP43 TaxID=3156263 RepID=UPI0035191F86
MRDNGTSRRSGYESLRAGGLDWDSLPMRLFAKGNRKFWNPADLDFSRDAEDFAALDPQAKEMVAIMCAQFVAGEEAVTQDIQPFMAAVSSEGRLGDEMYLAQFCFEEAKHVEVFRRWMDAVGLREDLNELVTGNPGYQEIFTVALPEALDKLHHDPSPANQVRASITYNHLIEGTLALTGYYTWNRFCTARDIFPGMRRIVELIGDDERRHMAWGTYTCRRHVAADAENWTIAQGTMRELIPHALRQIDFAAQAYPADLFDIGVKEILLYASSRPRRRLKAISSALAESAADVERDVVAERLEDEFAEEDRRQAAGARR